jgi:hypothetical protein
MIVIAVLFLLIGLFEWRYLKNNNRKQRTVWIVLGSIGFMFVGSECIYLLRERMTVAMIVKAIFFPIQKGIFFDI